MPTKGLRAETTVPLLKNVVNNSTRPATIRLSRVQQYSSQDGEELSLESHHLISFHQWHNNQYPV